MKNKYLVELEPNAEYWMIINCDGRRVATGFDTKEEAQFAADIVQWEVEFLKSDVPKKKVKAVYKIIIAGMLAFFVAVSYVGYVGLTMKGFPF